MPDKEVRVTWQGGLTFEATGAQGGSVRIVGDEGVAGLRPMGRAARLAGHVHGRRRGLDPAQEASAGHRLRARGERRPARRAPALVLRIDVLHHVEGEWIDSEAVRRSIELSVTRYCPVTAQLATGDVVIVHRYRIGEGEPVVVAESGPHGHLVVFAHGDHA